MHKSLFDKLCSMHTLFYAWNTIKQKGSSGGIDGVSITLFDEHLGDNMRELQCELKEHKWFPQPYMSISIPKTKNKNETRSLGLLSIKDKIVQQAIKQLIEYRFESEFVSNSFAYRPDKGHNKAVRFFKSWYDNPVCQYAVRMDIDNYFDNINHDVLFKRIQHLIADSEVFRLIQLCIKMGTVNKGLEWKDVIKGVPQGAVLSPLLANYYLCSFDQFVLSRTNMYVRYADDFIIGCTTREEAENLLDECSVFIKERLKLDLNVPTITDISESVEFLGVIINKNEITISDNKKQELINRIRSLAWENGGFNENGLKSLNGINNYYARLISQEVLEELDLVLFNRLKEIIELQRGDIKYTKFLLQGLKDINFFSEKNIIDKDKLVEELRTLFISLKPDGAKYDEELQNKEIIQKRKHEYRQKENESSEMIVSTFGTFIGVSKGRLSVKINGKSSKIRISSNLHHITIISDGVSMSGKAVAYCMSKHIGIDYFSYKGKHLGSLLSPQSMDTLLWNKQVNLSLEQKSCLAVNIIMGKIKNQINLIKYFHKYHKDKYDNLMVIYDDNAIKYDNIINEIEKLIGDTDYVTKIVCLEAQAAELYWKYIKEMVKDDVDFQNRERKGASDLFNCLLNYGYAILYSRVWQMILSNKMNPTESVIHVKQPGKPTFVYDVVELFRAQAVDRVVISLIQKKEDVNIDNGILDEGSKKLLAKNISERLNRYEKYHGKECRFCDIMNSQIADIAKFIDKDEKFKPYIAKW